MKITLNRDEKGHPRVKLDDTHAALSDFFNMEVRDNPVIIAEIESMIAAVTEERATCEPLYGNIYSLNLSSQHAVIENVYDAAAPACTLSLTEFRQLLEQWIELIRS